MPTPDLSIFRPHRFSGPLAVAPQRASRSRRVRARLSCSISLALCALLLACPGGERSDPRLRERVLSIDAAALDRLLERSARLTGTPLAREASLLKRRLADCAEVWGHWPGATASAAPSPFGCRDAVPADPELVRLATRLRGEHAGLLLWPLGRDGRLELRFDVDERGGVVVDGLAIPPEAPGALALFLPASDAPAPSVLETSRALVSMRMRPAGGLRLSRWIASGSQGDRLFALKGRLLEGALLSGTWELALLPPEPDGQVPLAVAALHHRLASPVREAVREALDQLEGTWPIRRTPRTFETAQGSRFEGGCYFDLPLLPDLAPCWVVTDEALLIGYREHVLDAVLAAPPVSSPGAARASTDSTNEDRVAADAGPDPRAGLEVHFDRMHHVDALTQAQASGTAVGELYSQLELRLASDETGRIAIEGRLRTKP